MVEFMVTEEEEETSRHVFQDSENPPDTKRDVQLDTGHKLTVSLHRQLCS